MKIIELEERLNQGAILSLIDRHKLKPIGRNQYRVKPCPICGDPKKDHFTVYADTNSFNSFSKSEEEIGGGVFKYLTEIEKLTKEEARGKLEEMAGVLPGEPNKKREVAQVRQTLEQQEKDFTNLIDKLYMERLPVTSAYFESRGISEQLIDQYKLSVFKDKDGRRAMLPVWRNGKAIYFTKRAIDDQGNRYLNATGTAQLFNHEELENAQGGDIIIITEGVIDALSVEEVTGIKAVAIGGTNHYKKITEDVEQAKARGVTVLTMFDNDEAGKSLTEGTGLPCIEIKEVYKDINQWIVEDRAEASKAILDGIENAQPKVDDISEYLKLDFLNEVTENRQTPRLKTSIKPLDEALNGGLYPGLHIIGGEPGVGKTAFAMQLADYIAEQGREVLYISLEMSKYELIARSISRIAYSIGHDREMITGAILNGDIDSEIIEMYLNRYMETVTDKLIIKQGDFNLTVDKIKEEAQKIKDIRGIAPAVIVDYLQILKGEDTKKDIRLQVDDNIVSLKRLSRDLNTPVILISALSRNGQANISMASFRESSGVEYGADSLTVLAYDRDLIGEKKEPKDFFKQSNYYPIEAHILKNRRGIKGSSIKLEWEPAYNYFHTPIRSQAVVKQSQKRR